MTWLNPHREKQLRDHLRDLPELAAIAAASLPGEHLAGEPGRRGVPGSRPPISVAAAALTGRRYLHLPGDWPVRDGGIVWVDGDGDIHADDELPGGVLAVLSSWVRLADGEMWDAGHDHAEPDETATVAGECAWLQRHIVWILEQQWVVELADDLQHLARECRQVLRVRPEYRPRCPREGCGGTLRDQGSSLWRCDLCDHTAGDRARLSLRSVVVQQQPMTVAELVRAFRLSTKTVESWVRRAKLQPVDTDATPLRYHPADALRLANERGVQIG